MLYINSLHEGDVIHEVYFCKGKTIATAKSGKEYMSLILQDRTGTLDGKVWEIGSGIADFEEKDYIYVNGQVTSFNNALQLKITQLRKADPGEYDEGEYMPMTPYDIDDMFKELMGFVDSVKDEYLHTLLQKLFRDRNDIREAFCRRSAAKSVHHACVGGLLQHTLAVTRICDFQAKQYPRLDRDLLITAAICHDIGKIQELSDFPENDYTDAGQLVGHIVIGAMILEQTARSIEGFPKVRKTELVHCILSHHGELEYGSPKKPELLEAIALSHADNMDAKIQGVTDLLESQSTGTEWLKYQRTFDAPLRATTGRTDKDLQG